MIAKGSRRQTKAGKSKFDGGLDLLDSGDAIFGFAPERELLVLGEWSLRDGHRQLRTDLRATYLGLYGAELLERLLEEHDPHPRLFDQFERLLVRLPDASGREAVFLAFQLNLLRQVGLLPDFARCADGSAVKQAQRLTFSPRQARLLGGEQSDSAPDAVAVSPEAIDAIQSLLRLARDGGPLPVITRAQADAANRLLALHVQEQTASRLRTARYVLP